MTEGDRREFGERLRAAGCSHGPAAALRLGLASGRDLAALLEGGETSPSLRAFAARVYEVELPESDTEARALAEHDARARGSLLSRVTEDGLREVRRAHTPQVEKISERVTLADDQGRALETEVVERLPDGATLTIRRGEYGRLLGATVDAD